MFRQIGGLALRGIDLLGKQTLCQLSYSRSAYAQLERLLEREGHSNGHRRLPQRSSSIPQRSYSG